jgi:hypothetical protein
VLLGIQKRAATLRTLINALDFKKSTARTILSSRESNSISGGGGIGGGKKSGWVLAGMRSSVVCAARWWITLYQDQELAV